MTVYHATGSVITYRDLQRGRVLWEAPHLVVEDGERLTALYIAPGTVGRRPADGLRNRYAQRLSTGDWVLAPYVWRWNHVLRLIEPNVAHSIELYWDEHTWALNTWYVNLQAPLRRTTAGFETSDHALDLVVEPTGSWHWKDEDDLAALVAGGYYTDDDARLIREEGLRVVERIESWSSPFCDAWEQWRPDYEGSATARTTSRGSGQ